MILAAFDINSFLNILPYVAIGIAYLLQSPIAKRLPGPVTAVLSKFDPDQVRDLVAHVATKEARRSTSIEYILAMADKNKVPLSQDTAAWVVDELSKVYKSKFGVKK
jgi:hypothetical protein